jgi:hypothetical protein
VLVLAGDDQGVEEIQRRRLDPDQRFARTGSRFRDLGQFKLFGAAVVGAENGFHTMSF